MGDDQTLRKVSIDILNRKRAELATEEQSVSEAIAYAKANHEAMGKNYWAKLFALRRQVRALEQLV